MQTFLCKPAQLDSRRLNKQSVECYQIAKVLLQKLGKIPIRTKKDKYGAIKQVKAWHSHPAVRMWEGFEWYFVTHYWEGIILECNARDINTKLLRERREEYISLIKPDYVHPSFIHNKVILFTHKHNLYQKSNELYPQFTYTQEFTPRKIPYIWMLNNIPDNQPLYEAINLHLLERKKNVTLS